MNRFLLCFWFAVALPGCGGITSAPTDALPQAARRAAAHVREASRDLLYASEAANTIRVYTYPQGAQVATITAVAHPGSECSDTSGNVFVRDWATRNLYEFAHGGTTPIQTLSPAGVCAVDPTTNDLAVLQGNSVLIFQDETGSPIVYTDSGLSGAFLWCTYDSNGNLFLLSDSFGANALTEFNAGTFTTITFSPSLTNRSGLQWDGKHLTIDNFQNPRAKLLERVRISGTSGTITGATTLDGRGNLSAAAIADGMIVGDWLVNRRHSIALWPYPAGGKATTLLKRPTQGLEGLTVSSGAQR
jgi:hypothetical protein